MLKMLSEIGPNRFVVVAETKTKKEARQLLNRQIKERNIATEQLDVIAGRNVYFGMHDISKRKPYYFTFLREPIERFISQYSYLAKCASDPTNEAFEMACQRVMVNGKTISIREFVERKQSVNLMTIALAASSSDEESPNSWWQVNPQEAPTQAKWMLEQMSFIGFLDRFERDARFVFEQLKLSPKVQRTNVSPSETIQVDPDTMRLIRQANELDLEIYDHARSLANR